jgi:hypothetical protein
MSSAASSSCRFGNAHVRSWMNSTSQSNLQGTKPQWSSKQQSPIRGEPPARCRIGLQVCKVITDIQ